METRPAIVIICVLIAVNTVAWMVAYIRMAHYVFQKQNTFNVIKFRLVFPLIKEYKDLTVAETGTIGPFYRHGSISLMINLLLVVGLLLAQLL